MCQDLTPEQLDDARNLLETVKQHGIRIETDGIDLMVYGTTDPDLLAVIKQRKPALLAVLTSEQAESHRTADWIEERRDDGTVTWCRPDQTGRGRIWSNEPLRCRPQPSRPTIGAPHPPRERPRVPPQIVAAPDRYCQRCQCVRTLPGVPGYQHGICYGCWLSNQN